MKKIKKILKETKKNTISSVHKFSSFLLKHKLLRIILSTSLIIGVGLSIAFCSGKKNSMTASASSFEIIALPDPFSSEDYIKFDIYPQATFMPETLTVDGYPTSGSQQLIGSVLGDNNSGYILDLINNAMYGQSIHSIGNYKIEGCNLIPLSYAFAEDCSSFVTRMQGVNAQYDVGFSSFSNFADVLPWTFPVDFVLKWSGTRYLRPDFQSYLSQYLIQPYLSSSIDYSGTVTNFGYFGYIFEVSFRVNDVNRYIYLPVICPLFIQDISINFDYSNINYSSSSSKLNSVTISWFSNVTLTCEVKYDNGFRYTFKLLTPYIQYGAIPLWYTIAGDQSNIEYSYNLLTPRPLFNQSIMGSMVVSPNSYNYTTLPPTYIDGYNAGLKDGENSLEELVNARTQSIVNDYNSRVYPDSKSYSTGYTAGLNYADGRVNLDSASYQAGLTAGADIAGLSPFQFIVNSVNIFLGTPLFTVGGWSFTLSYVIYLAFGMLLVGIIIKTFWGG